KGAFLCVMKVTVEEKFYLPDRVCYVIGFIKKDKPMDAIETKDFSAIAGYTLALLEMDEWINTRPFFYKIKTHYLVDQAIRLEYIIIQ
ncbi:hypothetical protein, partial [Acinetobacter junii]